MDGLLAIAHSFLQGQHNNSWSVVVAAAGLYDVVFESCLYNFMHFFMSHWTFSLLISQEKVSVLPFGPLHKSVQVFMPLLPPDCTKLAGSFFFFFFF